jgi:hypothetical protein
VFSCLNCIIWALEYFNSLILSLISEFNVHSRCKIVLYSNLIRNYYFAMSYK